MAIETGVELGGMRRDGNPRFGLNERKVHREREREREDWFVFGGYIYIL